MKGWGFGVAAVGLLVAVGIWLFRPTSTQISHPMPTAPSQRALVDRPASATPRAPVPAMAAPGSAPPTRLDFDSAENLYALAVAAAQSTDPMTLHNGHWATLTCHWAPQNRHQYEALAAGGAVSEERKRAARVVLRKCAGFFDNDDAANNGLRQRLLDGLRAHEGEYIPGHGMPSDKQLTVAIERGDWQTFTRASSDLVPRIHARTGIAPKTEQALLYGVAWLMAAYDLGLDCAPDGLQYAIQCAMHVEMCAGSWDAFNKRDITEAQQA